MEGEAKMDDSKPRNSEEAAASLRAWRAWRSKHRVPLEEALKNPQAWGIYKEMLRHNGTTKANFDSYEDWLASTKCTQLWIEWKRRHPKPLHEVLSDPQGWELFYAMKQEKGVTVPPTYEEWLKQQDQRRSVAYQSWIQWRHQHPGALTEVLRDPEGWALYKATRASQGAKLPETYEEWCRDPSVIKAMAMEAWISWRRAHPGELRKVLADTEGYELYRRMLEASGKQADPTYEDWRDRKVNSSWQAWRREHPGPLTRVLADPRGWQLYRNERNGMKDELPATYEEWLQLPQQQRTITKKGKIIDNGDLDNKKTIKSKGRTSGSAHKSKQKRAAKDAWQAWLNAQPSTDLAQLLQDPEGWELYRAAMSKPRRQLPETYEGFKAFEEASKAWSGWREEHRGDHVSVLKDPEGWKLYSSLMKAKGVQIPPTYEEWLQLPEQRVAVAATEWLQWRERHAEQPILQLLATEEEGWNLFRAFLEAIGTSLPASFKEWEPEAADSLSRAQTAWRPSRSSASYRVIFALRQAIAQVRGEAFSITYEEWLRTPSSRLRNNQPPSWKVWRRQHPGPLAEVLRDQEGWNLYIKKLQLKGAPVPLSYEEWLDSPQRPRQEATENWTLWRSKNRGPMVEVLQDPEGWKLYSAMKEATSGSPCEQFEEWQNSVGARKKALREWQAWRKLHPGPRHIILSDPLGWRLYRAAFSGQMTIPETYAEYVQARQPTVAWLAWRRRHRGPLLSVLADEYGWQVYRQRMLAIGKSVPEDFGEWAESHRAVTANGNSRRGKRAGSPLEETMETNQVAAQ